MHSRIFEISTEPIAVSDRKNSDSYADDEFVMSRVDYVADSYDREDDLNWLMECLPEGCFTLEGDCLTLVKTPTEYVEDYIAKIQARANDLTLDNVTRENSLALYQVKSALCALSFFNGICIDFEEEVRELPIFIIDIYNKPVGTKFYIGGVSDYHL